MGDYRIITDACCDLIPKMVEEHDIMVIPMEVTMTDGRVYRHYYDYREMSAKDFYAALRSGIMASTSQITPQKYIDFFTPILESGDDFIYIALSGGLSQTYSSSVVALQELREKYPDRKMYTFDSLSGSGGEGLLAVETARKKESGLSIEETAAWVKENAIHMSALWTVDDLMHLKRGGRVKMGAAIVGTALNLKPYGIMDDDGSLPLVGKCRGKKSSLNKLFEMFKEMQTDSVGPEVMVRHCDSIADGEYMRDLILAEFPEKVVDLDMVGPVIGAHLGPGSLCMFYWGSRRK